MPSCMVEIDFIAGCISCIHGGLGLLATHIIVLILSLDSQTVKRAMLNISQKDICAPGSLGTPLLSWVSSTLLDIPNMYYMCNQFILGPWLKEAHTH
jgi:hypothetical protein